MMPAVCRHKQELKQNAFKAFLKQQKDAKKKCIRTHVLTDGDWLQVNVPALHLCHSCRPWAKVLKETIHPEGVL